jgi:tetratricopeptide (TPR) repeat protein
MPQILVRSSQGGWEYTYPSGRRGEMPGNVNERVVTVLSHDVENWIQHGDEMMAAGNPVKAVEFYEKALEYDSNSAKAWHNKANALEAIGNHQEALRCYDVALMCDPGDAECWYNKGVALKVIGRANEGANCVNTGINIAMGHHEK